MRSTYLIILILLTLSCNRDDDQLDCPDQSDRTADVLAGPVFPARGFEDWAFLGNQYGGRGDAVLVTGYPFFLNWLDGCEEDMSVNIVGYRPETIMFPDNQVGTPPHTEMHSYLGFKTGETLNLNSGVGTWTFPEESVTENRTIVLQNVPTWDQVSLLPHTSANADIDGSVHGELSIELSPWYASLGDIYVVIKELGSSDFYAIKVDAVTEPFTYDFAANKVPVDYHEMTLGPTINWLGVYEVIDDGEKRPLQLMRLTTGSESVGFFVPETSAPHIVTFASKEENVDRFSSMLMQSLPTHIDQSDHGEVPVKSLGWEGNFIELDLSVSGYIDLYSGSNNLGIVFPNRRGIRHVKGPLSAGNHRVRQLDLPPAFRTAHPELDLPTDLFEDGYDLRFWHYPAASTPAAYWNFGTLSTLDRHLYSFYRIRVN